MFLGVHALHSRGAGHLARLVQHNSNLPAQLTSPTFSCLHAAPTDDGNNRTYQATCSASVASATLTLIQNNTDVGGDSCDATRNQIATADVKTKPTITVVKPIVAKVCSAEDTKTFTYTVSSTTGNAITITSVLTTPLTAASCSYDAGEADPTVPGECHI